MPQALRIRVLVFLALPAFAISATCLHGQIYGTSQQRGAPHSTNVANAAACKASCLKTANCRFFSFDKATTDCWLHEKVMFLQMKEMTVSGSADCIEEDTEQARLKKIATQIAAVASMVEERTQHEAMKKRAQQVKWSCENNLLQEEGYASIRGMITHLSEMITSPEGLVEVADRNAVIDTDDLEFLANYIANADVQLLSAEPTVGPDDIENVVECTDGKVACDPVSSSSFGAGTPWKDAKVHYCFDASLSRSSEEAIICAMGKIKALVPGVEFVNVGYAGVDKCRASPAVYIQSNGRRSGGGCWSDTGMVSGWGSNQKMNLQAPGCDNCGTAIHEMLHAMGMAHEQSRPDRDEFIQILWPNIRPGMESQFTKISKADTDRSYDIMSIMHYSSKSFSANGLDTIRVKPPGYAVYTSDPSRFSLYRIGQRMGMSRQDVSQLGDLYGCKKPELTPCLPPEAALNPLLLPSSGIKFHLGSFAVDGTYLFVAAGLVGLVLCSLCCLCACADSSRSMFRYSRV
mmetsp:Transcript_9315/g.17180  ORF Transcript_9315/g.17180 Transcript_9315/m.17180 type:complete len:518 (+) Transcript_9315:81-1634(+)